MENKDVIIIGGGPAGLAAAVQLNKLGITNILILEREKQLGGILRQCIHDGFGLQRFGESLSGPEYAQRFIDEVRELNIPYMTEVTVTEVTAGRIVTAASRSGVLEFQAKAIALTMGCRERTRGAISIPGTRPAGVYTAGVVQSYMNLANIMPGKEVVILGSGDIGLIMARRLTLEGAHVKAVLEVQPYASGLPRNIEQCLNDYGIPLLLSHTVVDIKGHARLEGVTVAQVDEQYRPIPGSEQAYSCDTLVLSVGLIPENELSLGAGVVLDSMTKGAMVDEHYQTSCAGIFASGNVLQVHDLVDFVSTEAERMAHSIHAYLCSSSIGKAAIEIAVDASVAYAVPQKITGKKDFTLSLRPKRPGRACTVLVKQGNETIASKKFAKVLPAEMIQLPVSAERINPEKNLEITII